MLLRTGLVLAALAVVIGIPFAMKPAEPDGAVGRGKADRLVIVSPHNEAIRHEFTAAFRRHHRKRTGRDVVIDWRIPGGTSEIARYLASEFTASFRNEWVNRPGKTWDATVDGAFDNPAVVPGPDPSADTPAEAARRAFLASPAGIGIDLFFRRRGV